MNDIHQFIERTPVLSEIFEITCFTDIHSDNLMLKRTNFFLMFSTAVEPVKMFTQLFKFDLPQWKNNPIDLCSSLFPAVFFQHPDSCTYMCSNTR